MKGQTPISIGIPVHGDDPYFPDMLESLRENTCLPCEVIIVEDKAGPASKKAILDFAESLKTDSRKSDSIVSFKHLINDENRGVPYSWNKILHNASGHYVAILNSDIVLTPRWDEKSIKILKADTDMGVISYVTSSSSGSTQQIEGAWHNRFKWNHKEIQDYAETLWDVIGEATVYPRRIVGFAFTLKREVIEKIGWFDERFGSGMYEETDYFHRLTQSGYRIGLAKGIYIHHYGSVSFDAKGTDFKERLLEENRIKFEEKKEKGLPEIVSREFVEND